MCVLDRLPKGIPQYLEKWTMESVMSHYGYPEKIARILENAYRDTFSAARINEELWDWFETVIGIPQGCVLSPLPFNIFQEMIMTMALDGVNEGADIGGETVGDMRFA